MDKKLLFSVLLLLIACIGLIQAGVLDRETHGPTEKEAEDIKSKLLKECGGDDLFTEPKNLNNREEADRFIRKAKCTTSCILKKINWVTDDNKINKTVVNEVDLNDESRGYIVFGCSNEDFFDKCSHVTDPDACDYAAKLMRCFKSVCEQKSK